MSFEKTKLKAEQFITNWNNSVEPYPKYALDLTWPSVFVLDYVLSDLRGAALLNGDQDDRLRAATCLIAVLISNSWSTLEDGVVLEVSLLESPSFEVTITATAPEGEEILAKIKLYSTLRKFFLGESHDYFAFNSLTRAISRSLPNLGTLSLALGAARSNYIEGKWPRISDQNFAEPLHKFLASATQSYARYCSRLYPTGSYLTDPLLFRLNLVIPPIGYEEDLPGCRCVAGLANYFSTGKLKDPEIATICQQLSAFPDELGSIAGALGWAAICEYPIPEKVQASLQRYVETLPALRSAFIYLRKFWDRTDDHLDLLLAGKKSEAESRLLAERSIGLHPLLFCPNSLLLESSLRSLQIATIAGSSEDMLDGLITAQHALGNDSRLIPLISHIRLMQGDFERAASALSYSEPSDESRFYWLCCKARIAQAASDDSSALGFWKQALTCLPNLSFECIMPIEGACSILIQRQDFKSVVDLCSRVQAFHPGILAPRILSTLASLSLGEQSVALDDIKSMYQLCPFDRQVFQLVTSSS